MIIFCSEARLFIAIVSCRRSWQPSGGLPELHRIKDGLDVVDDAGEVFQDGSLEERREKDRVKHCCCCCFLFTLSKKKKDLFLTGEKGG